MKVIVEYLVKKKIDIECDRFDDILDKFNLSDWKNGKIISIPTIVSRQVTDDSATEYKRKDIMMKS